MQTTHDGCTHKTSKTMTKQIKTMREDGATAAKTEKVNARLEVLGDCLRELRQDAGLTIRLASQFSKKSSRTVQNSEYGRHIDIETLLDLCDIYGAQVKIEKGRKYLYL